MDKGSLWIEDFGRNYGLSYRLSSFYVHYLPYPPYQYHQN